MEPTEPRSIQHRQPLNRIDSFTRKPRHFEFVRRRACTAPAAARQKKKKRKKNQLGQFRGDKM
jgi:hypothetical protein